MKEKMVESVTFEDINAKTLEKVLKFIYTGKVTIRDEEGDGSDGSEDEYESEDEDGSEPVIVHDTVPKYKLAMDVLYASEKFGLDKLKVICVDELCDEITNDNVMEILAAADLFNAKTLEEECLNYIYW